MDNQEAIETIKLAQSQIEWDYPMDYATAFDMAISALQAQDAPDTNVGDMIYRQAAIDALDVLCQEHRYRIPGKRETYSQYNEAWQDALGSAERAIFDLPSAQPEWNNHTVACLLAELFDDPCACNYNGIDEWLPEKCEVIDACPNPVGVACWEQYLKHRAERRTDEGD